MSNGVQHIILQVNDRPLFEKEGIRGEILLLDNEQFLIELNWFAVID